MFVPLITLAIVLIGTLDAQQLDFEINRSGLAPAASRLANQLHNPYNPWRNANDGYNSGNIQSNTPLHLLHDVTTSNAKNSHTPFLQIHPPREDPRLFYQSNLYLQENNGQNVNNEVSFIYPGREVVRAVQESDARSMPVRIQQRGSSSETCIRCPRDRMITLKQGIRHVKVPPPRLTTCSGQKASRGFRFIVLQGPRPGSNVEKGSHSIVGRIMYKHTSRILRTCKLQINVLEPSCRTPKYLVVHCNGDQNRTCDFRCRDRRLELIGESSLVCGDEARWEGNLPFCGKGRRWCTTPSPPWYGQVSCRGKRVGRKGFAEGSKCWVQCAHGRHRWNPRAATVCRRGSWTHKLSCQTRRK